MPLVDAPLLRAPLLRALNGDRPETAPVWFMRQAGRSLPEYRELRVGTRMLDACVTPELAAEITLQPVRRHRVDAAIFFSDIVVPLLLAGVDVHIEPGRGPVFAEPIRTAADVARLTAIDPQTVTAAAEPDPRSRRHRHRRARRDAPHRLRRGARSPWPPTSSRAAPPRSTCEPAR